jgi:hypothetical protein
MVIVADHSGSTFKLNGKVSKEFAAVFIDWLRETARVEGEIPDGPTEVKIGQGGTGFSMKYEIGETTTVWVTDADGGLKVRLAGDLQDLWRTGTPNSGIFREASYKGPGELFAVLDGHKYSLKELFKIAKNPQTTQNTDRTMKPKRFRREQ